MDIGSPPRGGSALNYRPVVSSNMNITI